MKLFRTCPYMRSAYLYIDSAIEPAPGQRYLLPQTEAVELYLRPVVEYMNFKYGRAFAGVC